MAVKRFTLADVAERAGVSTATASNALTGKRPVDQKTGARVAAIAAQLNYQPNEQARRLRRGRADTIALLSSMPFAIAGGRARMGFMMEIAGAAAVRALQSGIALILVPPLQQGRAPLLQLNIDGALVIEPLAGDPDLEILKSRGLPIVAIGQTHGATDLAFVDLQNYEGARSMLQHLRDSGARCLALVVGAEPRHSHLEAIRAYRDFIGAQAPIILRIPESGGEPAAREATARLLLDHPDIDALYVSVDVFAVGARKAAATLGLAIPQRLRLATRYDGVHARECEPPLTVLDLHLDLIGTRAVDILLEKIAGRQPSPSTALPPPTIRPRGSSMVDAAKPRA